MADKERPKVEAYGLQGGKGPLTTEAAHADKVVNDIIKLVVNNPNISTYSPRKKKLVSIIGSEDYKKNPDVKKGLEITLNRLANSKEFQDLSVQNQAAVLAAITKESTLGAVKEGLYDVNKNKVGEVPTYQNPSKVNAESTNQTVPAGKELTYFEEPDVYVPLMFGQKGSPVNLGHINIKDKTPEEAEDTFFQNYVLYNKGTKGADVRSQEALRERAKAAMLEPQKNKKGELTKTGKLVVNESNIRRFFSEYLPLVMKLSEELKTSKEEEKQTPSVKPDKQSPKVEDKKVDAEIMSPFFEY